jgi:3-isopropylmalate/(R)-2-methylmalate dehydratase small subunit
MEKFTTLEGVAAPLKIINVDTDMIIPKQYLKTIKRTGLGKGLFSEQRYKNGILPIRVTQDDLDKLFDDAERGANATLTIDLANQEIRGPDGGKVKFEIDPFRKHCLMNGLDDIGLTMEKKSSIDDYEAKLKKERAWA